MRNGIVKFGSADELEIKFIHNVELTEAASVGLEDCTMCRRVDRHKYGTFVA